MKYSWNGIMISWEKNRMGMENGILVTLFGWKKRNRSSGKKNKNRSLDRGWTTTKEGRWWSDCGGWWSDAVVDEGMLIGGGQYGLIDLFSWWEEGGGRKILAS
ncbi:hypothetical protein Dimus_020113 [Dionaea muscipula]